jgi:hypothetical protein
MERGSKKIISTLFGKGRQHDFKLFKSRTLPLLADVEVLVDSGYTGIKHCHANSKLPYKRKKSQPLTREQKIENKRLASERVLSENVNAQLKRFKIIADRYRNRRKRFGLRFNLIAGIHNFEVSK